MSQVCRLLVNKGQRTALFHSPLPDAPLPILSSPLVSWRVSSLRKAGCSLLPSDLSSHWGGEVAGGGLSDTLYPPPASSPSHCQSAPTRAPPSPTLYRGAPGEPGEQTQQIAERESAEPAPSARRQPARPEPAAQTPALRARPSRPFRCSSQDRGREGRRGFPAPVTPLPFPKTTAGSQAACRAAPHRPARQGPGKMRSRGSQQPGGLQGEPRVGRTAGT